MNDKLSFYLQYNNNLFGGRVLSVCYKANMEEMQEYGLTNENILILIKDDSINNQYC